MAKTIAVIGGDARSACLARRLAERGYEVFTRGLAAYRAPNDTTLARAASAETVILPVPLSKEAGKLHGAEELPLDTLWRQFCPAQHLYAGGIKASERAEAEQYGLHLTDYLDREELAVRNAVPTAEGAIAAAMEALPITLHRTPCLVVGFGRIGKLLAHRLHGLGAEVFVSARKAGDLAWIEAYGYAPLRTDALRGHLDDFRVVFNTVPAEVLSDARIDELRQDCLLIELASVSGFAMEAVHRRNLAYIKAGGLPGKVAPETAAQAIEMTLYQLWEEEK